LTYNISIIGASGYTGGELFRLLYSHPDVNVEGIFGNTTTGKDFSDLHPNFQDLTDMVIESPDFEEIGEKSDLVFAATPHGTSMDFVYTLLDNGAKVIDLSADYRLDDESVYEEYYGPHENLDLDAVYGLPELKRDKVKDSELIANPGCYPTSILLSVAPLLSEGWIKNDPIVFDSKSGTSGAGVKPSKKLHFPNCSDNVRAYNVSGHRHFPEIEQEVEKLAKSSTNIDFTPHLIPSIRGILSTTHAFLTEERDEEELLSLYREYYEDEHFVRVIEDQPTTNAVRGSNFCDLTVRLSEASGKITATSAIDNLVKGASGQAVQNMNIILGLDEIKGLENIPLHP